jgi:hypothetical protein
MRLKRSGCVDAIQILQTLWMKEEVGLSLFHVFFLRIFFLQSPLYLLFIIKCSSSSSSSSFFFFIQVALRKEVASYGKRHVCHRPNPVEQAWLQKIADEAGAGIGANGKPKPLATEKTSKARAKVALNESTERAKAQVCDCEKAC